MQSIFIFVPAFGWQLSTHTFLSTLQLTAVLNRAGIGSGASAMSHPDIEQLRNIAVSVWYETLPMYSHILFVDADIGFDPQMVVDMVAFGEPVVGGMYRKKHSGIDWAVSGLPDGQLGDARGSFIEMEGFGMGCALIRRDAIARMVEHYPELVMPAAKHSLRGLLAGSPHYLRFFDKLETADGSGQVSEDLSFCRRWRNAGGRVWGAGGHAMTHVGPFAYEGCYLDHAQQQATQEAAQ